MGRIAELESYIENLLAKIHNQEYEIEELKNLLYDVTHYYDDVLPQIRDKLEAS